MVKNKTDELDFAQMASVVGGVEVLDDMETVKGWIDTGLLGLNYILSGRFIGGGVPIGRIIEIFGDSASGKSLLGTNILRGVQTMGGVPILLDAERAISKEFAQTASKIDAKRFYVMEADTLEGCFNKIYNSIRDLRKVVPLEKPIVIVYDSIAASPSEREFAETELDMETASAAAIERAGAGKDKPGERAKTCSKHFRNLPKFLKDNHASLVVINQIRQKIGIMFGSNEARGGGGRALEYYASQCIRVRANRITRDKNDNVLGINITAKIEKNRHYTPFLTCKNMYLFFKQGINPFGGLLELLIQTDRIEGKGTYTVKEPYAGGEKITFRASKERNDVPSDVLLQCPALVDAESPEQIQYYLDLYSSAIDAVDKDIATEQKVDDEYAQDLGT